MFVCQCHRVGVQRRVLPDLEVFQTIAHDVGQVQGFKSEWQGDRVVTFSQKRCHVSANTFSRVIEFQSSNAFVRMMGAPF